MRRVADLPPPLAQLLIDALRVAGISASRTDAMTLAISPHEAFPAGIWSVWVDDDSDTQILQQTLQSFFTKHPFRDSVWTCTNCGYDFRGHDGDGRCPECGNPFRIPPSDVACPHCGEAVPDNFGVCWSCGGNLDA
jgi:rubredoxin